MGMDIQSPTAVVVRDFVTNSTIESIREGKLISSTVKTALKGVTQATDKMNTEEAYIARAAVINIRDRFLSAQSLDPSESEMNSDLNKILTQIDLHTETPAAQSQNQPQINHTRTHRAEINPEETIPKPTYLPAPQPPRTEPTIALSSNIGDSTLSMIHFQMKIIKGEAMDEKGRMDVFDVNAAIETLGDIAALEDSSAKQERELAEEYLVMLSNHPNVSSKISDNVIDTLVRNNRTISENPSQNVGFSISQTLSTIVKEDLEIRKTLETRNLQKPEGSSLKQSPVPTIDHKISQLSNELVSLTSELFKTADKLQTVAPKYYKDAIKYIKNFQVEKFSEELAKGRFDLSSQKPTSHSESEKQAVNAKTAHKIWTDIGKLLTQYNDITTNIRSLYAHKRAYAEELAQQDQQGRGKSSEHAKLFRSHSTSFNAVPNSQRMPTILEESANAV
ncbi:hypothetical protein ACVBEF_10730 [Glaciimonas sp. GG7]